MDEIRKVPPVTRFLVGATLTLTVASLLSLVNPYHFLLWWPAVVRYGQIWRLVTSFFLTGGGIQLIFDLFLLGRNSLDLEVNSYNRRTSEYVWSLLIIGSLILATNYPLQTTVLFNPMLMALNYLWVRNNPSASVSLFGLVACPAPFLPYAYLLFDLLRGGVGLAIQSATGLLSAHVYYYITEVLPSTDGGRGLRLLPSVPAFLRRLLPDSVDPANTAAQSQRDLGSSVAGGGRILNTRWGGTAFAPRGREFGNDQSSWGGPNGSGSSRGQTIGSSGGTGTRAGTPEGSGWLSRLMDRGLRIAQRSHAPPREVDAATQRRALLEATERRLRAQRDNSIAGRHAASVAADAGSGQPTRTAPTPAPVQGMDGSQAAESMMMKRAASSSSSRVSSTSGIRSRFGNFDSVKTRRRSGQQGEDDGEEQLDASGSGGSVAEQRWVTGKDDDDEDDHRRGHHWGTGQRLGE